MTFLDTLSIDRVCCAHSTDQLASKLGEVNNDIYNQFTCESNEVNILLVFTTAIFNESLPLSVARDCRNPICINSIDGWFWTHNRNLCRR